MHLGPGRKLLHFFVLNMALTGSFASSGSWLPRYDHRKLKATVLVLCHMFSGKKRAFTCLNYVNKEAFPIRDDSSLFCRLHILGFGAHVFKIGTMYSQWAKTYQEALLEFTMFVSRRQLSATFSLLIGSQPES